MFFCITRMFLLLHCGTMSVSFYMFTFRLVCFKFDINKNIVEKTFKY